MTDEIKADLDRASTLLAVAAKVLGSKLNIGVTQLPALAEAAVKVAEASIAVAATRQMIDEGPRGV